LTTAMLGCGGSHGRNAGASAALSFAADFPPVANGTTVGVAVIKLPRVGSTWLKAELNLLPRVFLEFEPLTDGKHREAWCGADFTNAILRRMLTRPQHCVNRKMIQHECFWTKQACDPGRVLPRTIAAKPQLEISGFLLHPFFVPSATWPPFFLPPAVARLVVLRRSNLVKRAISNMLRKPEEEEEEEDLGGVRTEGSKEGGSKEGGGDGGYGGRKREPNLNRTVAAVSVLREATSALGSFLHLPDGLSLSAPSTFLLLYEDLQNSREAVLRRLLAWLGKPSLAAAIAPAAQQTHWTKAPESVCQQLSNCDEVRTVLAGAPCFLSQLLSDSSAAWTLPAAADGAPNGRAGACVELPRLSSRDCYRRRLSQLLPGWDGASSRELGRESGADTLTGVRSWSVTSGPAAASPGRGDPSRDPSRPACRMTNSHGMPRAGCATLNATPSAASAPAPSSAAPASSAVASPLGALAVPPSPLSAIDIPPASPLSRPSGASRAADAVDQRQDPEHNRGDNNQRSIRRFTDRASLAPPVRAAAAARAARFIIFSRQRSASSTFVAALNTHPHVACGFEVFAPKNSAGDALRRALGFSSHADAMSRLPDFMRGWWSLCPASACGFKVFNGQMRPSSVDQLRLLFAGGGAAEQTPTPPTAAWGAATNANASCRASASCQRAATAANLELDIESSVRVILLERANVSAEWESLRRAVTTGNWGTSPARQQAYLQSGAPLRGNRSELTAEGGAEGAEGAAGAATAAARHVGSLAQFTREHEQWFELVRAAVPRASPRLHLQTEDLTGGAEALHGTMQRVFRFLGLPPLRTQLRLPVRLLAPESAPHSGES